MENKQQTIITDRKMKMKGVLFLLFGVPIIISFLAALISQYIALLYCNNQIANLTSQLFESQVMYSQILSQSISLQLSNDLQKFPMDVRLINNYYAKVLNGKVKFNNKHVPSIVHIEALYYNHGQPELINLFKISPILINTWYHKNDSSIDQLSQQGKDLLVNANQLTPLMRAMEVERNQNNNPNSRYVQYNLAYIGYDFQGMMFSNTINTTYTLAANPECGPGTISTYDPRCRLWYLSAKQQHSIHFQQPLLTYTEKYSFYAQSICQRMRLYNSTSDTYQMHHVFCFSFKLTVLQNYFQNYAKTSLQTYVIDPISQIAVFDSQKRTNGQQPQTLSSLELSNLQSKEEAQKFNQTIKDQFLSEMPFNTIDSDSISKSISMQVMIPYNRNGTNTYLLFNPVYVFDKLPQPEGDYSFLQSSPTKDLRLNETNISSNKNNQDPTKRTLQDSIGQSRELQNQPQWNALLAYIQINIISDEELQRQTNQLNIFFKKYYIGVGCFLIALGIIFIVIAVLYSMKIRTILILPIQQLIDILNKIHQEKDISKICYLIEEDGYSLEELFHSKETHRLYESLNEVFKIMRFSQENFHKENLTKTLMHLHDYLNFFKKFDNYYAIGIAHNNIGSIFLSQDRYYQALEHFSSSIIYIRYEIQQFCLKNKSISQQILLDYCYDNHNSQKVLDTNTTAKKKNSSLAVNASSNAIFNSSNNRQSRFNSQKNSKQLTQNKDHYSTSHKMSEFGRQHFKEEEDKLQPNNSDRKKLNYEDKIILKYGERFEKNGLLTGDINNNQSNLTNELTKEIISLITTMYYRKKNYILTLIAFQEYTDNLNSRMEIKNDNLLSHKFWSEIKQLLNELLNIASELPFWESQQIEILLNIAKCQFKLSKFEKYQTLLKFCEDLISKMTQETANQYCFDQSDYLYNYSSEDFCRRSIQRQCAAANQEFLSHHQFSFQSMHTNQQPITTHINTPNANASITNHFQHFDSNTNCLNSYTQPILSPTQKLIETQTNPNSQRDPAKQALSLKISSILKRNNINSKQRITHDHFNHFMSSEEVEEIIPSQKNMHYRQQHHFQNRNTHSPSVSRHMIKQQNQPNRKTAKSLMLSPNKQGEDNFFSRKATTSNFNKSLEKEGYKNDKNLIDSRIEEKEEENLEESSKNFVSKIEFKFMFGKSAMQLLYNLIKSEYHMQKEEYKEAAEILTQVLENNQNILSHIPCIIKNKLTSIFKMNNIYSKELQHFSEQFNSQLNLQVCIVYDNTPQHKKQGMLLTQNAVPIRKTSYQNNERIVESQQLTKIYLLLQLLDQVLIHKDDSLNVIKTALNNDGQFTVNQILETLKIPQLRAGHIIESTVHQLISFDSINFEQKQINSIINNIHSDDNYGGDASIDRKYNTQLEDQERIQLKQKFNQSEQTSQNNLYQQPSQMQSLQPTPKSLFKSDNEFNITTKENKFSFEPQKIDLNNYKTQPFNVIREQSIDVKRNIDEEQEEENITNCMKKFFYTNLQTLQESKDDEDYYLKIKQNNGDDNNNDGNAMMLQDELYDQASMERRDKLEEAMKMEQKNKNQLFHFSMRKAIDSIIDEKQFLYQQLISKQTLHTQTSLDESKSKVENNSMMQILQKKFIIFCTNELQISKNNLLSQLSHTLGIFNIQLIIFICGQNMKDELESESQDFFSEHIKTFSNVKKVLQYLETQRNQFSKEVSPTYLQHF